MGWPDTVIIPLPAVIARGADTISTSATHGMPVNAQEWPLRRVSWLTHVLTRLDPPIAALCLFLQA